MGDKEKTLCYLSEVEKWLTVTRVSAPHGVFVEILKRFAENCPPGGTKFTP